jgi:hypothetical protein
MDECVILLMVLGKMSSQSIYDLVMKDHFKFAQLTGSVYCAVAVLAKVNEMTKMLR